MGVKPSYFVLVTTRRLADLARPLYISPVIKLPDLAALADHPVMLVALLVALALIVRLPAILAELRQWSLGVMRERRLERQKRSSPPER